MLRWVKCENIVKLIKTLSDSIVGGVDNMWLIAETMIDEYVIFAIMLGQLIVFLLLLHLRHIR